eukprot:Gb_37779 [translate_table: standard]
MGASVLWLGEWLIKRMPLVKHIYSASKQISAAISPDQNTQAFKEVAIIRHPRVGEYAFGFITSSVVLQNDTGEEELCCIYVPTNHLYIGDIFLINSKDVIRPNLSVREGIDEELGRYARGLEHLEGRSCVEGFEALEPWRRCGNISMVKSNCGAKDLNRGPSLPRGLREEPMSTVEASKGRTIGQTTARGSSGGARKISILNLFTDIVGVETASNPTTDGALSSSMSVGEVNSTLASVCRKLTSDIIWSEVTLHKDCPWQNPMRKLSCPTESCHGKSNQASTFSTEDGMRLADKAFWVRMLPGISLGFQVLQTRNGEDPTKEMAFCIPNLPKLSSQEKPRWFSLDPKSFEFEAVEIVLSGGMSMPQVLSSMDRETIQVDRIRAGRGLNV